MKVLVVGPFKSPIIKRMVSNLKLSGVDVYLASHNASGVDGVLDLGEIRSILDYFKFWKINKIIDLIQPDIIHAHVLNHYGVMCSFNSKPLVVGLWGSDVMLAPYEGNILKRLFYRYLNWFVLKRSTRCHTSSEHIKVEAGHQAQGVLRKIDTYYWGFPLEIPSSDLLDITKKNLDSEFNLFGRGYYIFPRGLGYVYNPEGVAKIIHALVKSGVEENKIIVLKGFSSEEDVSRFASMVYNHKIVFIDRLLNDCELYYLYKISRYHFSIPTSDALGGGVIEPALLGSFPILSSIKPYVSYVGKHGGYILENMQSSQIEKLTQFLSTYPKTIDKSEFDNLDCYSADEVTKLIVLTYKNAIRE